MGPSHTLNQYSNNENLWDAFALIHCQSSPRDWNALMTESYTSSSGTWEGGVGLGRNCDTTFVLAEGPYCWGSKQVEGQSQFYSFHDTNTRKGCTSMKSGLNIFGFSERRSCSFWSIWSLCKKCSFPPHVSDSCYPPSRFQICNNKGMINNLAMTVRSWRDIMSL